jgi:hypothetical protein
MKVFLLAVAYILSSCGAMPGLQNGDDGKDGESPKCYFVQKQDGKSYLVCKNPDGTAAEAEILRGQDGEDGESLSVSRLASCSWKSDLYSVKYNVVEVDKTLRLSSLSVTHLKTPKVYYQGAVLHAEGDEGYGSAEMKLSAWSAKLVGEKKAEITQIGSNPQEMVCK